VADTATALAIVREIAGEVGDVLVRVRRLERVYQPTVPPARVSDEHIASTRLSPIAPGGLPAPLVEALTGGEPRWTWSEGQVVGLVVVRHGRTVVQSLTEEASEAVTAEVRRRQVAAARAMGRGEE